MGQPAVFLRLAGCNLRCTYCDTAYSWGDEYIVMTLGEIMLRIKKTGISRVTLTGGEPLCAPNVGTLVGEMLSAGMEINIETNGSMDIKDLRNNRTDTSNLFFTIDYKLPSSGQTKHMCIENYDQLLTCDVLKFVVGSDEDMSHMLSFVKTIKSKPQIFMGVVYGKYDMQKLVSVALETPQLVDAKIQVQLHKIIWNENERGV